LFILSDLVSAYPILTVILRLSKDPPAKPVIHEERTI
jgi:hypothetical protein